jgi:hypothetical protein
MELARKIALASCAAMAIGASMAVFASAVPQHTPTLSRDVQLVSGDELIVMSGTGTNGGTPDANEISTVQNAVDSQYGTDFGAPGATNTDALTTPEGLYNGTFQDDEIVLLNDMTKYQGDDVTVFGVSQSGGAVGLAINDLQAGDFPSPTGTGVAPLPAGFSEADLPSNIHWVALAPDTMPLHDNAGGQFSYDPWPYTSHTLWGDLALFPTNAANADVYCGMYDPTCDYPTSGDSYATNNSEYGGTGLIHGGYTSLSTGEWNYELSHATEFTINNDSGAVAIYPGDNAPADVTHFWLMPDVKNFGTDGEFGAAGTHYDSFMPALDSYINNVSSYEELLPVTTLEVDAGYDDALHPFEYMINGVDYTFYNDQVVQVADLPTGVTAPIVSESDYWGADGYLADEIEWGLISPTGSSATEAASTVATGFGSDFAADLAGLSHLWTELMAAI